MSLLRITKQTVWRPFADDLNIERGIVRGWVVFIPRSAEIQPIVRGFYKQRIPNSLGIHLTCVLYCIVCFFFFVEEKFLFHQITIIELFHACSFDFPALYLYMYM